MDIKDRTYRIQLDIVESGRILGIIMFFQDITPTAFYIE